MFWNKKPKLPITLEDQIWVEESLTFLRDSLGEEKLLAVQTVEPTKEFFSREFDGSEADAKFILERCQELMDIPKEKVSLEFYSEEAHYLDDGTLLSSSADIMGKSSGAAGSYQKQGGKAIIRIERGQLKNPESLIATISHELAHEKLLGENRIIENDEYLTDLTAIAFGFGIFIANAKFKFQSGKGNGFGWQMKSQGYLPEQVSAYAMASLSLKRKESHQLYKQYLDTSAANYFDKSLAFLNLDRVSNKTDLFWPLTKEKNTLFKNPSSKKIAKNVDFKKPELKKLQLKMTMACARSDFDEVEELLELGVSPNYAGVGGSPLSVAISKGNEELTALLMSYGADINFSDPDTIFDMPVLMKVCEEENMLKVRALIDAGAEINIVGGNRKSVLEVAVETGNTELVGFLIEKGASLEMKTGHIPYSETPICAAVMKNDTEMVSFLVKKGAKTKPIRKLTRHEIHPKMVKFLKARKYL